MKWNIYSDKIIYKNFHGPEDRIEINFWREWNHYLYAHIVHFYSSISGKKTKDKEIANYLFNKLNNAKHFKKYRIYYGYIIGNNLERGKKQEVFFLKPIQECNVCKRALKKIINIKPIFEFNNSIRFSGSSVYCNICLKKERQILNLKK